MSADIRLPAEEAALSNDKGPTLLLDHVTELIYGNREFRGDVVDASLLASAILVEVQRQPAGRGAKE